MAVSARRFTCSFGHSGVSACKPLNTQRLSAFSFVMAVEDLVAQAVWTRAADLARSARLFVLKADQGAPGLTRSRVSVRAAGTWYSRRTLGLDVLACPRCGWRLRLIALIEIPSLLERFLPHLGCRPRFPTPAPRVPSRYVSLASPVAEATRTPSSTSFVECAPPPDRRASGRACHSCARPPSTQAVRPACSPRLDCLA